MPCKECKDGNYKYGNTGECKYANKEACEKANPKKYNKMQPTPLGKKSYEEYEKELKEFNLSKVERVELANIKELEVLVKKAFKEISESRSWKQDLKSVKKAIDVDTKAMEKIENELQKARTQIRKQADELGVDFKKIPEWNKADDAMRSLESKRQSFEVLAQELKKVTFRD